MKNARVVDQDVDLSETGERSLYDHAPILFIRDVLAQEDGRLAEFRRHFGPGLEHIGEYDVSAFGCKKTGLPGTLPARRTRDNRDFSSEPFHM